MIASAQLHLAMLAGALLLDALFGYPQRLFRAIRHPVVWMGAGLDGLERRLNRPGRPGNRWRGCLALAVVGVPVVILAALPGLLTPAPLRLPVLILLAAPFPAQRSLRDHVRAVAVALEGDLHGARRAVSHIVGRDPASLDRAAVARAAMESLAENFSDGVVAPAVWAALAGLPGLVGYKLVNTADSMLGHRTPRHRTFGWASARLDDWVNLPGSRIAAAWIIAAAALSRDASARAAWRAVRRDARRHRSPNAGWPEAAMAGALGLRLAGPRRYGSTLVDDAWMGDGRAEATQADVHRALRLFGRACALQLGTAIVLASAIGALKF